jgi:hypothetical protein
MLRRAFCLIMIFMMGMDRILQLMDFIPSRIWVISVLAIPWMTASVIRFNTKLQRAKRQQCDIPRFPWIPILLFIGPILVCEFCADVLTSVERNRLLWVLGTGGEQTVVRINGAVVTNSTEVVSALRMVATEMGHHSHPIRTLNMRVQSSRGVADLVFGRDSGYSREYWVFSEKYRCTSLNEIGRIHTPIFDQYPTPSNP